MVQNADMAKAALVQSKYTEELLQKRHVIGVGLGLAQKDGQATGEVALVVMVDEKIPQAQLALEDQIPSEIEGVRVDVQAMGSFTAF
ncbi:MAG TPA: hypothetical protein VHO69_19215 [Phototrophicaceae bacterium]|nr:hypothetical protein [Phototrophicaceae bacterium]